MPACHDSGSQVLLEQPGQVSLLFWCQLVRMSDSKSTQLSLLVPLGSSGSENRVTRELEELGYACERIRLIQEIIEEAQSLLRVRSNPWNAPSSRQCVV